MNPLTILRDAWYFFTRNLGAITLLGLPLIVLEALAQRLVMGWASPESAPVYEMLTGLLFYPIYSAALILFLDARSRGQQPRTRDLLTLALWLWPTFALLVGLSNLLIMLGLSLAALPGLWLAAKPTFADHLLVVLGASLLALPGLWLMVKLAFAEYLLVLRGLAPLDALRESVRQTKGHFWPLLFCVLTVVMPVLLLNWFAFPAQDESANQLLAFLLDCVSGFLLLFATVVLFRFFMLVSDPPAKA